MSVMQVKKHTRWGKKNPMPWVYTTCLEMFGSGVKTDGTTIIFGRHPMGAHGKADQKKRTFFAVAPGAPMKNQRASVFAGLTCSQISEILPAGFGWHTIEESFLPGRILLGIMFDHQLSCL